MMKCVVIDDEPVAIEILDGYIAKIPFLDLAGTFRSAIDALEYLRRHPVDLLFLDINMPDLTGIEFLKSLDSRPMVIFTTAHSEYAAKSYDFEAIDYLLKPIEFDRFLKASRRALDQFESARVNNGIAVRNATPSREETILVKDGTDYHRFDVDDILYIKSAGNYVTFVTKDKKIMSLMKMKEALDRLPADHFVRVHRSYIVAFKHIDVIEVDCVLVAGTEIPIGESYRSELRERIQKLL